MPAVYGLYAV